MSKQPAIEIGLNAAIVAMVEGKPAILKTRIAENPERDALPYGRFETLKHRTMEEGLRSLAEEQTGLRPGYVEQLYTFGDRGRMPSDSDHMPHVVSVGYLALTRNIGLPDEKPQTDMVGWRSWYEYFPWEDWRVQRPAMLDDVIIPVLRDWAHHRQDPSHLVRGLDAESRVRIAFGLDGARWEDEQVLERYELMYSAGLLPEAVADSRITETKTSASLGMPMVHDHRRILATAIARLRSKLKYRPVIFELMPDTFTLFALQQTVESIFGRTVHKQNFRRLVENAELVEPTGASERSTGGRPAALFRFRSEILKERPAPGLKVGRG